MALRDIYCGEELTFDYSCVSESREEFYNATCLCGFPCCRGSFVSYIEENAFMQYINCENTFLKATARLLDVCYNDCSDEDMNALYSAGIRVCWLLFPLICRAVCWMAVLIG